MNDRPLFTAFESGPPHAIGRLWLAFLIMPVVSALIALGVSGGSGPVAILVGILAIFVTACGALPAFISLKQRGPLRLSQALWAGAALGNVPNALFAFMSALFALAHVANGTISDHLAPVPQLLFGALNVILLGTAVGAGSAAVFWFVGIRGTDWSE